MTKHLRLRCRKYMSRYNVNFYVLRLYFVYYGLTDRRISTFYNIVLLAIVILHWHIIYMYICVLCVCYTIQKVIQRLYKVVKLKLNLWRDKYLVFDIYLYLSMYLSKYLHICNHENNVPCRLLPQWLCGNSCTWSTCFHDCIYITPILPF